MENEILKTKLNDLIYQKQTEKEYFQKELDAKLANVKKLDNEIVKQ